MFATEGWLLVCGKTRILLGNPDKPIKRSHKKNVFFKKSKTIDALVQKIQLNEHGKFRCYVMFATMDMPIYMMHTSQGELLRIFPFLSNSFSLPLHINLIIKKDLKFSKFSTIFLCAIFFQLFASLFRIVSFATQKPQKTSSKT
jgi:hypothetical protein